MQMLSQRRMPASQIALHLPASRFRCWLLVLNVLFRQTFKVQLPSTHRNQSLRLFSISFHCCTASKISHKNTVNFIASLLATLQNNFDFDTQKLWFIIARVSVERSWVCMALWWVFETGAGTGYDGHLLVKLILIAPALIYLGITFYRHSMSFNYLMIISLEKQNAMNHLKLAKWLEIREKREAHYHITKYQFTHLNKFSTNKLLLQHAEKTQNYDINIWESTMKNDLELLDKFEFVIRKIWTLESWESFSLMIFLKLQNFLGTPIGVKEKFKWLKNHFQRSKVQKTILRKL